jgi:hypothetical protein
MMIDRPGGVALFARSPAIASALTFSPSTSRCLSRLVATAVAISASSEIPAPGLAGYPRRYPGALADGKMAKSKIRIKPVKSLVGAQGLEPRTR